MNSSKNLEITGSRHLINWLQTQQISLALTTYQSSRLFLVGVKPDGTLSGFERLFNRAMGLYATPERLYMSSRYQLWQFDNVLAAGELDKGYDKLYVPRVAYTTGDLDIHDLVVDKNQNIIFVNTLYNCLATLSERHSFKPLWQPPFISKLVAEDRCHLNGLAMVDGEARYVTAISQSDVIDGWRERQRDGGCVIDIKTNEIIAKGLSMPHSPRWYQGKLWLLNSGEGEFGYIENGKFKPLTFCPGYMRGLAFSGDFAIVALSKAREKTFTGLALDEKLAAKDVDARCGVMIINLKTGEIAHWLRIEGVVTEFYDVQVLAGVQRAKALGFKTDEIQHLITIEKDATEICRLHNARMRVCDWQNYDVELQRLIKQIELHIKDDNNVGLPILEFNALPIPLSLHTKVAQHMSRRIAFTSPLYQRGVRGDLKKLRIGYISPDFRQHAVGRLIYPLFAAHNREVVEVFVYDLINADDELTKKIRAGCDVYVDLSKSSHKAAAQRIHEDGIHILIDLAGYTTHARPQILALQPAPIQVQFLGFPNTMGADFIQYLLADSWLIPEQLEEYYTEKVVYLPHAFVGAPLPIAERNAMTRAEFGLAEDATVFCVNCINAHHKIDPSVFAAWMEILRQVPDSILWITDGAKTMRDNLQQAAASYDIAPERLVFVPKLPLPEYLARLALADLALDTFLYTGGFTAVANLLAGLPLLTRVGETYASRMAASICAAAELEQLICDNTDAYIKRAVELVTQKQELATIRTILQKQREQLPLFDMKNFAQHLEAAYQKIWNLHE
jgi:uncharacterized protein (TIGR03032 family)